jgi:UDP-N-acetylglucosamine acyltransferase
MIHPLAYVDPDAKIGANCEIGAFAFIDKNVVIGDNCIVMPQACILNGTRMGNNNKIYHGAIIGGEPQDLKFVGEETTTEIGDNNMIRENVTISRGTASKGTTKVGSNNLLMENSHIGHDSVVGNGCIIGNSTKIAGEVTIHDCAILSACVLVHQFSHIGSYVMIQGGSRINKDVPPYIIVGREPARYSGLNIIGLRRRGFSNEAIKSVHEAYRQIYESGTIVSTALARIKESCKITPEVENVLNFIEKVSERGIIG